MQIKEVTYSEARLISTAQYENARVEVGCMISIDAGEDLDMVLEHAKKFVRDALTRRIIDMEQTAKQKVYSDQADRVSRKYRL